ncbi:MAG: hypothetical protein Q7S61_01090, partial [bacterium]|nr:hypothetical protein [bacterium]
NLNLNPPTLTPTPQGGKDLPVTINVTDPNNNYNRKVFSQEDGSTPQTCFSMSGDSTSGGGPCGSLVAGRNYTVYVKLYNLSGGEVAFGANSVTSKQFTLPTGSFSVLFDKIFMPVDLKAPVNLRASCTNPTGPMSFTWSNTSSVSIAKNQIARYSYGGNPWNYDFGKVAGSATAFSDIYASYSHTYRYMVRSCGDDACTKVSAWSGNTGDVICPAPTSTPTPTRTPTPSPTPTPTFTPVPTIVASANLPTITDFSANEQTMGQSGEIPKCGVVKMYWKTPPPSEISVDGWEMNFYNSSGLQATRFIPVGATCYGCDSGAGSEKWQAEVPDVNLNAGEKCIFMAPPSYSDTDSGAHVSLRAVKGNEKGQETVSNNFYASSIQRVWYSNDPTPVILGTCKQQCGDFDNRSICTDQGGVCSSAANCQPTEIFSGYCGRQGNTDWGACCKAIEPPTPTRTALTPSPSNGPTQLAIRGRIDINQDAAELDIFIFRHMGEMNVELMRDRTIQYKDVKLGQSKNYEFTNLPSDSTYEVLPLYFTQIPTDGRLNHIEKLLGVLSMRVAVFAREPESPAGVEMEITLCSGEVVLRFNHKRCSMLLDNQQGTNLRANFTVPSVPRALDFYIPHRNASFSINQGVKDAITCYIKKRFRPSHTIEAVRSDWDAMVQGAISGGWNSAFVTALWIEESGGTTSLGCISEPGTVADQIACINSTPASYKSPDEKGFDEFMCRWSGEPRPAPPDTRSCLIPFINNANFLPVIKDWYFNGTALSSVDQLPSFIKNCQ